MAINKAKIGNALTSVAPDHVVAVANDIYDEAADKYQSEINADTAFNLDLAKRWLFKSRLTEESTPYDDTIKELYCPQSIQEGDTIVFKAYRGSLYVRVKLASTSHGWQSKLSLTALDNNIVYEIPYSSGVDTNLIETTACYVVFKDVEKLRSYLDESSGTPLVYALVNELSIHPQICAHLNKSIIRRERIADEAISSDKIENFAVTNDKLADNSVTEDKLSALVANRLQKVQTSSLQVVKSLEKYYINTNGIVSATTSNRGVIYFANQKGKDIHLVVPSTGNSYSVVYAYSNNIDSNACIKPGEGYTIGTESKFDAIISTEDYKYLVVCYTLTGGEPIATYENIEILTDEEKVRGLIREELAGYSTEIKVQLPRVIHAVVSDNLQVFRRSIVRAVNPYNYDLVVTSNVGKLYPRYYQFLPTEQGEYSLNAVVRDENLHKIGEAATIVKVANIPTSPSSMRNVLCVGASATAGGYWPYELMRRLTMSDGDGTPNNPTGLGLENIQFVGRKVGSGKDIYLEATGGWSVQNYAGEGRQAFRFYVSNVSSIQVNDEYTAGGTTFTISEINVTDGIGNISCLYEGAAPSLPASGSLTKTKGNGDSSISYSSYVSEKYNPFYNNTTGKLDFRDYATRYCDGHIDVFVWHCGVNGIFSGTDESVANEIEAFKSILTAFHADFPASKVVVSSVPIGSVTGGFGANYGASDKYNYDTFLKQAMNYAKALDDMCSSDEFSNYTIYAPVLEEFDVEYGYPTTDVNVNNRVSTKEALGTNGVHPTLDGYKIVADSMYRTMCHVLNSW